MWFFFPNNMHLHNKSDIGILCTKKNLELSNNKIQIMCFIAPKQKCLSVDWSERQTNQIIDGIFP